MSRQEFTVNQDYCAGGKHEVAAGILMTETSGGWVCPEHLRHEWTDGPSFQWGAAGMPASSASTPFICQRCGVRFYHYYNRQPDIHHAMQAAGIPALCHNVDTSQQVPTFRHNCASAKDALEEGARPTGEDGV